MQPRRMFFYCMLLASLSWACSSHPPMPAAPVWQRGTTQWDMGAMFASMADSGKLCRQLRDKFVGLPGTNTLARGPQAHIKEGRLWVRSCEAYSAGNSLRLRFAGPAWVWVNESESGFRVRQHVYFNVSAELSGRLTVGFDNRARVASLWLSPLQIEHVVVRPLGHIQARPETLGALVIDVVTLGQLAPAKARQAVASLDQSTTTHRDASNADFR